MPAIPPRELERIGPDGRDAVVVRVGAPDLGDLEPRQRVLAWHLYRAAIAGDPITWDQVHRHAAAIRDVADTIHPHLDALEPDTAAAIDRWVRLVWIHHGPYHHYTFSKIPAEGFTRDDLARALEAALAAGAPWPRRDSPRHVLRRIERTIFDRGHEPLLVQHDADDVVAASAVNYWDRGVTSADIEALGTEWSERVNARFARRDGRVVPEVYRVGGRCSSAIERVCHWLEGAAQLAESDAQRRMIRHTLSAWRTGDPDQCRRAMIAWLEADDTIDFVNGLVEVYHDPRGVAGMFEGNVSVRATGDFIDGVSARAAWFEARMPWPDAFKREHVDPPVANAVDVIVETGDAGPVSPAAYNLPNDNEVRRDYGSRNVMLRNVENTWSRDELRRTVEAFFLPEYRDDVLRWYRPTVRHAIVCLHEIVGHGSGRPHPDLGADPRTRIGAFYSALEECRADLVALYHVSDPAFVEMGAWSEADRPTIERTAYIGYLQGWFARLDHLDGLEVREAHDRGHHTILSWLLEDDGRGPAARLVEYDGHWYVRLGECAHVRERLATLLERVQVIKSTGDAKGAEALFARYGSRVRAEWKRSVAERRARLALPRLRAFVFPRLEPVVRDGRVVDAVLRCDDDLASQMRRFRILGASLDPAPDAHLAGGAPD